MNRSFLFSGLALSLAMLAGACSDDSDSPSSDVLLEFLVVDFGLTSPYPPVGGATVCLLGTDDCGETDEDGVATLEVPAESEIALTVTKDEYFPVLSLLTTGVDDLSRDMTAILFDLIETLGAALDTPIPPEGTGAIAISALDMPGVNSEAGIAGATYDIMDSSGKSYYFVEQLPSLDAEATTTPLGTGGFVELPPGEYTLEYGGAAEGCEIRSGWAGDAEDTTNVLVVEGYITFVYLICEPT